MNGIQNMGDSFDPRLSKKPTMSPPAPERFARPQRFKALPERIQRAIQIEYTHSDASRSGLMGRDIPQHIPAGGVTLIQDSILLANSHKDVSALNLRP
jgi:hypothetical protein